MKFNIQPVIEFTKKTGTSIKNALAPKCREISEIYSEYDINVTKKTHLSPSKLDETGNEANVVTETCSTKLKINLKNVLCALAIFAVFCTLLRAICKKD